MEPTAKRRPGRPRLTPEDWRQRLEDYCRRYDAALGDGGMPPFPSGRRESAQHREWMALYKARRRLAAAGAGNDSASLAQRQDLLNAQKGRCPVCQAGLELSEARLDDGRSQPEALHPRCFELVRAARQLGPDALDRVRVRL